MADIKAFFGTNKSKEQDGVFVSIFDDAEICVKRAGLGNKAFAIAQSKAYKPHRREITAGVMDFETLRKININLFANHIVTGWKNIEANGEVVEFSKENFVRLAIDCPDFWDAVFAVATDMQTFQDAEDEELIKKPVASIDTD